MKRSVLFFLVISLILILGSCGIYHEPCEGVVQIDIITDNL